MTETIRLSELEETLRTLSYPADRERAAAALDGTTLQLADGEVALGEVIAGVGEDRFVSVGDLAGEVRANLPREAVGEPYQSEGEG